jgi:hypothetical protein
MARPEKFDGFNYRSGCQFQVLLPFGAEAVSAKATNNANALAVGAALTLAGSGVSIGGVGITGSLDTSASDASPVVVVTVTGYNQFRELVSEDMTLTKAASGTAATAASKTAWTQITGVVLKSKTGVTATCGITLGYDIAGASTALLPVIGVPWRSFSDSAQIDSGISVRVATGAINAFTSSPAAFTQDNADKSTFHPSVASIFTATEARMAMIYVRRDAVE